MWTIVAVNQHLYLFYWNSVPFYSFSSYLLSSNICYIVVAVITVIVLVVVIVIIIAAVAVCLMSN